MRAGTSRSLLVLGMVAVLAAACGSGDATASPPIASSGPASTPDLAPSPSTGPLPSSTAPSSLATPAAPIPAPTPTPVTPASAKLPVRGLGEFGWTEMKALPEGRLLVIISARGGDVLAVLDPDGKPAPGWPVQLTGRAGCSHPAVVGDGSIRLVCGEWDRDGVVYALDPQGRIPAGWPVKLDDGRCTSGLLPAPDGSVRIVCRRRSTADAETPEHVVFALDANGGTMDGWPVTLSAEDYVDEWSPDPRLAGDTVVLASRAWFEVADRTEDWLVTVDRGGAVQVGTHVPTNGDARSTIGPDGVAYVVEDTGDSEGWRGWLTAYDLGGVRPGWPVTFTGMGSVPAFGPDGRLFVIAATWSRSRVLALDVTGGSVAVTSPRLGLAAADPGVDCAGGPPTEPTVTRDGTVFAWKFTEAPIYALDPSLKVRDGWPYVQPEGRPADACAGADGICCNWSLDTARTVGADGTLYLALQRRKATVGGRITAIGIDGKVRAGWPVELRRPGSMFTAIELGTDGVVYALATEPEGRGRTSATILAIEPDGSVRYHATVADP